MSLANLLLILFGILALEHLTAVFFVWHFKSYNIPVTILRYVGGKERPLMIATRAKKLFSHGVPRLFVKGYKDPIRDYLSKNYFPTVRGKYGGLILWEFEDGLLTPCAPIRKPKKMSAEAYEQLKKATAIIAKHHRIPFEYEDNLHNELRLKAVDDVDIEFNLQEQSRVNGQYAGGWRDFLEKYASHAAIIIIAILMLVAVIIVLDKLPGLAAQCANAATDVAKESILRAAAASAAPAG